MWEIVLRWIYFFRNCMLELGWFVQILMELNLHVTFILGLFFFMDHIEESAPPSCLSPFTCINNISWVPHSCAKRLELDLTLFLTFLIFFLCVFICASVCLHMQRGQASLRGWGGCPLLFISGNEWKELAASVDLSILSSGFVPHLWWGRKDGGGLNADTHLFSGFWGVPTPLYLCISALAVVATWYWDIFFWTSGLCFEMV